MATLVISRTFGLVLIEVAAIALQVNWQGTYISKLRKKLFDKQFYEKNFPELAKDPEGSESGYPDMGGGHFSQKLSLHDWMTFANAQRAHYNYLENVASIITCLTISGLFFPRWTAGLGAGYIVARHLYGTGYRNKGAKGRKIGGIMSGAIGITSFFSAVIGAWGFLGGFDGLKEILPF